MNRRVVCFSFLVLLLACVTPADAQRVARAEPLPDLRPTRVGTPYRAIRQSDGKLIVAGDFSLVGDKRRMYLARFNVDGSLDVEWNPGWSHPVGVLAIDDRDTLFVYGFTGNDGHPRALGKFDRRGVRDTAWNPVLVDGDVFDLVVDGAELYVAGSFQSIGGFARAGVARVNTVTGAVDPLWSPSQLYSVNCLLKVPGAVFLGGNSGIAKVSDEGAGASVPGFDLYNGSRVPFMAFDTNGNILAVMDNDIGIGIPAWLARLHASTGQFLPGPGLGISEARGISQIIPDGAGNLLVAGRLHFTQSNTFRHLIRVRPDFSIDATFNPSLRSELYPSTFGAFAHDVVLADNGDIDVVGRFDKVGQTQTPHIGAVRVDANGIALDGDGSRGFIGFDDIAHLGDVRAIARDPASGSVYVGGDFKVVLDVPSGNYFVRDNLFKLDRDLALDTAFAPVVLPVQTLEVTHAGEVIIASTVNPTGPSPRTVLKRLLPSGQTVPIWLPLVNSGILETMAMTPDGAAVYFGGSFRFIDVEPFARVARLPLSGDGYADEQFNPGADASVLDIAVNAQASELIAAGAFGVFGGASRPFLAKSSRDGVVDPAWRPAPDSRINTAVWDRRDMYVFAGGLASSFGVTQRALVAKIPADGNGAVDESWNAGLLPGGEVRSLLLAETDPESLGEEVLIGGRFDVPGEAGVLLSAHAQTDGASRMAPVAAATGLQGADDRVVALQPLHIAANGTQAVLVGGRFAELAGSPRASLAAVRFETQGLFVDSFE